MHNRSLQSRIVSVADAFNGSVVWLTPSLGKPLAILAVAAAMSPLALLMFYVTRVLVPDFVKWYYDETINQKAREYWRRKCTGTGMTIRGAKISIAIGVVFFFLVRFVASLPMYYQISLPAFILAFFGVAVVGYFVGGNVPDDSAARYKYFRRFQPPTVTGVGLGVATVVLEFVLEVGTLAVRYVHAI